MSVSIRNYDKAENRTWLNLENNITGHFRSLIVLMTFIFIINSKVIMENKKFVYLMLIDWYIVAFYAIYRYYHRFKLLKENKRIQDHEKNIYIYVLIFFVINVSLFPLFDIMGREGHGVEI